MSPCTTAVLADLRNPPFMYRERISAGGLAQVVERLPEFKASIPPKTNKEQKKEYLKKKTESLNSLITHC
jgi:hypothetical protein